MLAASSSLHDPSETWSLVAGSSTCYRDSEITGRGPCSFSRARPREGIAPSNIFTSRALNRSASMESRRCGPNAVQFQQWSNTAAAVWTHAAPVILLSASPPTMAVLPSADSATERPCPAVPTAPVPTSLLPCWVQTPPLRVKTHAAPAVRVVFDPAHDGGVAVGGQRDRDALTGVSNRAGADQLASLLGPDAAAAGEDPRRPGVRVVSRPAHDGGVAVSGQRDGEPCSAFPTAPVPTSLLPCWVQTPPLRVKTHAAPVSSCRHRPPTMAVLPSADSATERPCPASPTAPVPTSLLPCWVQTPPLRVKTHAAPVPSCRPDPPTMAVLPSADSATEMPCSAASNRAGADQLRCPAGSRHRRCG